MTKVNAHTVVAKTVKNEEPTPKKREKSNEAKQESNKTAKMENQLIFEMKLPDAAKLLDKDMKDRYSKPVGRDIFRNPVDLIKKEVK